MTLSRNLARHVSQEAIVGILYVVADCRDGPRHRSLAAGRRAREAHA